MALIFRRLVFFTACFAFVVIVVGAYVRLEDAGLGCPDWPGCYGQLVGVPVEAHEIARAEEAFSKPVDVGRARKEMFHRYIAGTLGVLILAIALIAWSGRAALRQSPALATALLVLVALQAVLGKWTVTMLLKPVIVTLHLLGGMATLALLTWLALRQVPVRAHPETVPRGLGILAVVSLAVVFVQIALGGWVSTNYAALACIDDGADVICMGSTTMHQAVPYLREHLPVPVINPGPLTYKLAEFFIGLGLSQSRRAYAKPNVPKLDMLAAMRTDGGVGSHGLELRVGINSGPVVAGVIGRKRFLYDLWGDAVNTASRMESQGAPGRIQITTATKELLDDEFACEPRGTIWVKGKGEMEVWYLVGPRTS